MAGIAGVLFLLLKKRLVARWPSLFSALALELATDLVFTFLLHTGGHYKFYFYLFWVSAGIQALLRLWIIGDIIRSFPGLDFLPRSVYLFVGVAGAVMATASAAFCYHSNPQVSQDIVGTVLLLNRCVNIAWAGFSVVILASIKFLNFGWSRHGAAIATGVFLRICCGVVVSELLARPSVRLRLTANGLDCLCSIAISFFWIYVLTLRAAQPDSPAAFDPACRTVDIPRNPDTLLLFIQGQRKMKSL